MPRIKTLFIATRPGFFPASVVPVLLGASEAWRYGGRLHAGYLLVTILGVIFFHGGMNVLNDYFDYLNGTDNLNRTALPPFTGGSGLIQAGELGPMGTLVLGAVLVANGSLIGLYLAISVAPVLLLIGGAGLLTGIFYSAPPVFFAGRGLGELVVGLDFGVLAVLGSFVVQRGAIAAGPISASLPISFLIAAILYINEFPDTEADRAVGKKNLVVRLGPRRALRGFYALVAAAYLSIISAVLAGALPVASLLGLASAPLAIRAALVLRANPGAGPALVPGIKSLILAHASCGLLLVIGDFIAR